MALAIDSLSERISPRVLFPNTFLLTNWDNLIWIIFFRFAHFFLLNYSQDFFCEENKEKKIRSIPQRCGSQQPCRFLVVVHVVDLCDGGDRGGDDGGDDGGAEGVCGDDKGICGDDGGDIEVFLTALMASATL